MNMGIYSLMMGLASQYGGALDAQAAQVAKSGEEVGKIAGEIRELTERMDRMTLVCAAMWSLLEETGLTQAKLLERIRQLDLADGRADGKISQQVKQCPQCKRAMSLRHARCLYCGAKRLNVTAFDGLA